MITPVNLDQNIPVISQINEINEIGQVGLGQLRLSLWKKGLRLVLFLLNVIVILISSFFALTGKNFAGKKLNLHPSLVIFIVVLVDTLAFFGIVNTLWFGKLKNHLKLSLSYSLGCTIVVFASLAGSYFINDLSGADIVLIVVITTIGTLILGSAYIFTFCIYRLKVYEKWRKKQLKHRKY